MTAIQQPKILLIGDDRIDGYKIVLDEIYAKGIITKKIGSLCHDVLKVQVYLDDLMRNAVRKGQRIEVVVFFTFCRELLNLDKDHTTYQKEPDFDLMFKNITTLVNIIQVANPNTQVLLTAPDIVDLERYNKLQHGYKSKQKLNLEEGEIRGYLSREEVVRRLNESVFTYIDLKYCRPRWASKTDVRVYRDGMIPSCYGVVPHLFAVQLVKKCGLVESAAKLWSEEELKDPRNHNRRSFRVKRPLEVPEEDMIRPLVPTALWDQNHASTSQKFVYLTWEETVVYLEHQGIRVILDTLPTVMGAVKSFNDWEASNRLAPKREARESQRRELRDHCAKSRRRL